MSNKSTSNQTNSLEEDKHPSIAQSMVNITNIIGIEPNFNPNPKTTKQGYRIFKDEMRTFQEMSNKKKGDKIVTVAE